MQACRHPFAPTRAAVVVVVFALAAAIVLAGGVGAVMASASASGTLQSSAAAAEIVPYYLPLPAATSALVTQGNGGLYTHIPRRSSEFAWDFLLPTGSLVVAAAQGTVVDLEQGFRGGGLSDNYASRANYVVLAHADGRYSLYLHLAYRGALVTVGEHVYAGQGIALSGATGYASGPHLHFQVQSTSAPSGSQSVPVRFVDAGVPEFGDRPVSGNVYDPPAPAPRPATPGLTIGPPGDLLTHQNFPVLPRWVDEIAGSAATAAPPVRVVTTDDSGERRYVTDRAVADVAGPFTIWAEYYDGAYWRIAADAAGRPAAITRVAVAHEVFLSPPGLTAGPLDVAPGGSVSALFSLVDLGAEDASLYGLALTATRISDGLVVSAAPVHRMAYLRPGGSLEWRGTVTLTDPGVYVLSPHALDPAGAPVMLPAAEWGDTESMTAVVTSPPPPDPPDPPDPPGPPDPGDAPTFSDVPEDHPAYAAAEILADRGLLTGYPDGAGGRVLRPDAPVTRAQFTKLLVLTLGLAAAETDLCPFVDVEGSGPDSLYPDNFIAAAARAGLVLGLSGEPPRFAPYSPVSRRQVTAMVTRATSDGNRTIPGDEWAPATRGEAVILLAGV